jgi:hypothetical protein
VAPWSSIRNAERPGKQTSQEPGNFETTIVIALIELVDGG